MALSIGSMISIGLRLFQYRAEIERLAPQVSAVMQSAMKIAPQVQKILEDANKIAPQVQWLAQQIAPELFGTARVARATTYNVQWLQQSLKTLGHDPGPIDGVMGDRTREAIKAFQKKNGLFVDGWAGMATEAAIDQMIRKRA